MASRTHWSLQCTWALICWGVCPWLLASRIWQRRRVKASEDRKPCFRVTNSAWLSSRTITDLMPVGCQVFLFCQPLSRGFALVLVQTRYSGMYYNGWHEAPNLRASLDRRRAPALGGRPALVRCLHPAPLPNPPGQRQRETRSTDCPPPGVQPAN